MLKSNMLSTLTRAQLGRLSAVDPRRSERPDPDRPDPERLNPERLNPERLDLERLDLERILGAWARRESQFTFLESPELPADPAAATALCNAILAAERLCADVERLQATRAEEGRAPLPEALWGGVLGVDELVLLEELLDEGVIQVTGNDGIDNDDPTTSMAAEAGALLWGARALVGALCEAALARLPAEGGAAAPEEEGGPWALHLPLRPSPLRRAGRWRAAWGEGGLRALWEEARAAVDEGALREEWLRRAPERAPGLQSWEEVWREHISPAGPELALRALRAAREEAAVEDVADEFERLACARRPKDQRLAGVVFWGESGEQVTVMFAKRDGQLLAQRDITWDPTRPEGAVEAFASIKIRTLVVPCELPPALLPAVEALTARYEVARVSSVGMVEVGRPANLTPEAQRAWQLAQRFSAPLRFWARAHIHDIARATLPPALHEVVLGAPDREARLSQAARCRSDARWLDLRRRRLERDARAAEERAPLPARPLRRGEQVQVTVTSVAPHRLRARHEEDGREALVSGLEEREGAEGFREGDVVRAYVLHDHPDAAPLSLTLRPLRPEPLREPPSRPDARFTRYPEPPPEGAGGRPLERWERVERPQGRPQARAQARPQERYHERPHERLHERQ
ncbi:MAG: hypothetical protein FJ138_16880, partial [Deltaproteobacteria bacterium]|nr:hypothetical protein [Deltaproteobacteria bacterium]